jgi:hypothetical protein
MPDTTRELSPAQFDSLFRSVALDSQLDPGQVVSPRCIAQVVARKVGRTCDRIFTPLVTLAVFHGQNLSGDHSCRGAAAAGWRNARWMVLDPDLASIRSRPDSQLLVLDMAFPADPFAVVR